MRVLMIAMQYPIAAGESYLTTELAEALVAAGHEVEVLHLDWHGVAGAQAVLRSAAGIRVVRCAPPTWGKPGSVLWRTSKFLRGGRRVARVARKWLDLGSFDVAIGWMPALAMAPLLPMLAKAGIRHRLLFIWDFFPEHHHEIGRIPGGVPLWVARGLERRLLRHFTAIFCTLAGNADYLRRHYPVHAEQQVTVTPVWGPTSAAPEVERGPVRARHGLPEDAPLAVFGGQLVAGRGIGQILAAARMAAEQGSRVHFVFAGAGPEERAIRDAGLGNVTVLPPMARGAYLELVAACDCGIVATVAGVRSFSFPSKLVDYLRAQVPVVVAVERGSELNAMIAQWGIGRCVGAGDGAGMLTAIEGLVASGRLGEAARRCLDEVFDVRHAVAAIAAACGDVRQGATASATTAAAAG